MELAAELGVLPSPARTCLVTGSKGKGTVSRMIAWNLAECGRKVGLVLSPEELGHLDRVRIGNQPIPELDFLRFVNLLSGPLDKMLVLQPSDFYFSPSGIFLLVALLWFREQGVDTWVIEGGRGARFDEIGLLYASVGVVTNVLGEHLVRLGSGLDEIAADKLSLGNRCEALVIGRAVSRWEHLFPTGCSKVIVDDFPKDEPDDRWRPTWFRELVAIARAAAGCMQPGLPWRNFTSPSFLIARGGFRDAGPARGTVCCEAAVHRDCLDAEFLRRSGLSAGAAVIGVSDDKDGEGLFHALAAVGFRHIYTVAVSSRVGHIRPWSAPEGVARQIAEMEIVGDAGIGFAGKLLDLADRHGSLYIVGVQTFMRSVRRVLNIGITGPGGVR